MTSMYKRLKTKFELSKKECDFCSMIERISAGILSELVYASVFLLNSFPNSDGTSQKYSPRTIITSQ